MLSKATIQLIISLKNKKFRDEHQLFVAEGDKLVNELLSSSFKVREIYTTDAKRTFSSVTPPVNLVTEAEIKKISGLKTPSSVLATVEIPGYALNTTQLQNELLIALDTVQDPGNLGTIIRLADWFGVKNIICSPDTADCFNPKVVQATMGAIARVKVHYTDLPLFLQEYQTLTNNPVYGTFLEGKDMYKEKLSNKGIIVLGNEGKGISTKVEELVGSKLFIPPYPVNAISSESLNVAVAAAIICAEFRRQA